MKSSEKFYDDIYRYFYIALVMIGLFVVSCLIISIFGENHQKVKKTSSRKILNQAYFRGITVEKRAFRYYDAYVIYAPQSFIYKDIDFILYKKQDTIFLDQQIPYLIPLHIGDSISKIKDTNLCRIVTKDTAVYTYFYDPFTPCAD